MADNTKEIKKGEVLIREGDLIENLYVIKSGRFLLFIERNKVKIEIAVVNQGQLIGDRILFQNTRMPYSVMAQVPSTYLEVPLKLAKDLYEKADAFAKILMKGMADALFETRKSLQSVRMENVNSPCPEKVVPRLFAGLCMIAAQTSKQEEDGKWVVAWSSIKLYTIRFFLENPTRMQGMCEILTKLKYANMIFRVVEDEEVEEGEEPREELAEIEVFDMSIVQDFAEFYQYHYYKPGRSEILIFDKTAAKLAEIMAELAEGAFVDHKGASHVEYNAVLAAVKEKMGVEMKPHHLDLVEKKGLFAVRKTKDDVVYLVFDKEEFRKTAIYWKIIHEIDKWNERGFVDMDEKEPVFKPPTEGDSTCSACSGIVAKEHKFCPHCGEKVAQAA